MVHEKNHRVTDEMRESMLELLRAGLPTKRVSALLGVSSSTVSYLAQIVNATTEENWNTLRRLNKTMRPTVQWALKKFDKTMPEAEETSSAPVDYTEPSTNAKLDEILKAVNSMGYILGQILDKLS